MNDANFMARCLRPILKTVGLGWVDYRCMHRTFSSMADKVIKDPKAAADQMGHGVDVNQNVYTQTIMHDVLTWWRESLITWYRSAVPSIEVNEIRKVWAFLLNC